jgi:hypothetical protein
MSHVDSHGQAETEKLKQNVQEQLNRLITQLQDLDEFRSELDDDEYEETRVDTVSEMKVGGAVPCTPSARPIAWRTVESHPVPCVPSSSCSIVLVYIGRRCCCPQEFDAQLKKLMEGNVSLVDSLGSARLALHAAFSQAFKNKEVIQMFAKREPAALRTKLQGLSADRKLGRVSEDAYKSVPPFLPLWRHITATRRCIDAPHIPRYTIGWW